MVRRLKITTTTTAGKALSSGEGNGEFGISNVITRNINKNNKKFVLLLSILVMVGGIIEIFMNSKSIFASINYNNDCSDNNIFSIPQQQQISSSSTNQQQQQPLLSSSSSYAGSFIPQITTKIPLIDLVNTNPNPICPSADLRVVNSTILSESITHLQPNNRKIPNIIHMTTKSRCMTSGFIDNINKWRFPNYSIYIHDDDAVDRLLLEKYWPEFPMLRLIERCTVSGAGKSDIWRLLVLWEYGGIYTDIDNAPGPQFLEGSAILDDDDGWFLKDGQGGYLSQWFMVVSPKHPFMHVCITHAISRLLTVDNIQKQYVAFVTGPGVTKNAMSTFMKNSTYSYPPEGKYFGIGNRSITVKGGKSKTPLFVERESINGPSKRKQFNSMGMKHWSTEAGNSKVDDKTKFYSCHEKLYYDTLSNTNTTKNTP